MIPKAFLIRRIPKSFLAPPLSHRRTTAKSQSVHLVLLRLRLNRNLRDADQTAHIKKTI